MKIYWAITLNLPPKRLMNNLHLIGYYKKLQRMDLKCNKFWVNFCCCRNVIDVAALDSHNLQQHEYVERMKLYNLRVQQVCSNKKNKLTHRLKNCILEDIPWTDKILQSEPINTDDKNLVR